jgi:polar amino acid transport system ATP-binding protein
MTIVVNFQDVSFNYPKSSPILDGLSFTCASGSVCALIGPSGSGKTTILRLAAGLEVPNSGMVDIEASAGKISEISYVSQTLDLWPHLSALQNVAFPLRWGFMRSEQESQLQAQMILDRLGLSNYSARFPSELSGGQRQRVAIGRAMAVEPKLLLLDEITAALDPETAAGVLRSVIEMKPSDQTVIIVTHHLGFASRYSDQVFFIEHGKLVEIISGQLLLSRPKTQRLQAFVSNYH